MRCGSFMRSTHFRAMSIRIAVVECRDHITFEPVVESFGFGLILVV